MSIKVTNFREFDGKLREFNVKIKSDAEKTVRRVAFAVDKAVVLASPVDTGRFRANWQVTLNVPASGMADFVPGSKGSTGGANAAAAMSQLAMVMKNYRLNHGIIYIVNNTEYGPALNNGHSKQAPKNFVSKAIQAGISESNR
jgi:hypothetical protein